MDTIFLTRLLLSFLVGGIWIAGVTVIADRAGSKLGGFIGGLPSTVILAYFFIALTQGTDFAVEATNVFPLAQVNAGLFLVIYLLVQATSFWKNLFVALFVWLGCTILLLYFGFNNFTIASVTFILFYIIAYIYFKKLKDSAHVKAIKKSLTVSTVLFRFLLGGGVIALTVIMSELGGPVYGGVFSAFPAMFFSTVLLTYLSQGQKFSRSIAVSLFSSGMLSVFVFVLGVRMFFLDYGFWWGSLLAYVLAVGATCVFYYLEKKLL